MRTQKQEWEAANKGIMNWYIHDILSFFDYIFLLGSCLLNSETSVEWNGNEWQYLVRTNWACLGKLDHLSSSWNFLKWRRAYCPRERCHKRRHGWRRKPAQRRCLCVPLTFVLAPSRRPFWWWEFLPGRWACRVTGVVVVGVFVLVLFSAAAVALLGFPALFFAAAFGVVISPAAAGPTGAGSFRRLHCHGPNSRGIYRNWLCWAGRGRDWKPTGLDRRWWYERLAGISTPVDDNFTVVSGDGTASTTAPGRGLFTSASTAAPAVT